VPAFLEEGEHGRARFQFELAWLDWVGLELAPDGVDLPLFDETRATVAQDATVDASAVGRCVQKAPGRAHEPAGVLFKFGGLGLQYLVPGQGGEADQIAG